MVNDAEFDFAAELKERAVAQSATLRTGIKIGRAEMAREVKAIIGHWGVQKQHLAVIGELLALCSKEGA